MSGKVTEAIWAAHQAIGGMPLAEGMKYLVGLAQEADPEDRRLQRINRINFVSDAREIARGLDKLLTEMGSKIRHLYFGLDGLNMAHGKGIEIGGAEHQGDEGFRSYRAELPSQALSDIYRNIETLYPDYLLALGYLGMALRDGFKDIGPISANRSGKISICFGYHDGDLFPLGELSPSGFALKLGQIAKPARPQKAGGKDEWREQWPTTCSADDWVIALGAIAAAIADGDRYTHQASFAIERLVDRGRAAEASCVVEQFLRRIDVTAPDVAETACRAVAVWHLALGQRKEAAALLEQAWTRLCKRLKPDDPCLQVFRDILADLGFSELAGDLTDKQRLDVRVRQAQQHAAAALTTGDTAQLETALRDIKALGTQGGVRHLLRFGTLLVQLHLRLGQREAAREQLHALPEATQALLIHGNVLPDAGLQSEMVRIAQGRVQRALAKAREDARNSSGVVEQMVRPILCLARAGLREEARTLLEQAEREAQTWPMEHAEMAAVVHTQWAMAHVAVGHEERANALLNEAAGHTVDAEGLWEIAKVQMAAKAWDAAVATVKRIQSGEKRRAVLAAVLAKAGRSEELAKVLAQVKTPEEACEVAWKVAFTLDGV